MKHYQDYDPLHGSGKAIPHPNRPTNYTYRGSGRRVSISRETFTATRNREAEKATRNSVKAKRSFGAFMLAISALVAMCPTRGARKR